MRKLLLSACSGLALAGCDVSVSGNGPVSDVVRVCRAAIDAVAGADAGADVQEVSKTAARLTYGGAAKSMGAECRLQDGQVLFPAASAGVAGPTPPRAIRYRINGPQVVLDITNADGSHSSSTSVTTGGGFNARMSVGDQSTSGEEQ